LYPIFCPSFFGMFLYSGQKVSFLITLFTNVFRKSGINPRDKSQASPESLEKASQFNNSPNKHNCLKNERNGPFCLLQLPIIILCNRDNLNANPDKNGNKKDDDICLEEHCLSPCLLQFIRHYRGEKFPGCVASKNLPFSPAIRLPGPLSFHRDK